MMAIMGCSLPWILVLLSSTERPRSYGMCLVDVTCTIGARMNVACGEFASMTSCLRLRNIGRVASQELSQKQRTFSQHSVGFKSSGNAVCKVPETFQRKRRFDLVPYGKPLSTGQARREQARRRSRRW